MDAIDLFVPPAGARPQLPRTVQQIDRHIHDAKALVIDANAMARSVLAQQLRSFGITHIRQAIRTADARGLIEHQRYDIILCDDFTELDDASGQDLLEELRREQLLPYETVFVMRTSEATYQKVAEAAEAALDVYLIKPFSANTLAERLREARARKRELKDIFHAIEADKHEVAIALCLDRFENRRNYWLYAARIGAELLLAAGRHQEAQTLYDAVIAAKTVPWARLGVARAQMAAGDVNAARRTLENLIGELPQFADSYDVMGKVQMEQGKLDEALATYRTAAQLTPGCVLRLQRGGTLSFYAGDAKTATELLERAWSLGSKSRLFDVLSMMLLAFLRFDAKDGKALGFSADVMQGFAEKYDESVRLRRMATIARALTLLHAGRVAQGIEAARKLAKEVDDDNFDFEAATNLLSLYSRLDPFGLEDGEVAGVVRQVAQRFCVARNSTEVLASACRALPAAADVVRDAHTVVMAMAENAMNQSLRGRPRDAVQMLMDQGELTRNAKLIEMAGAVAQRHAEKIADLSEVQARVQDLHKRYCAPATHIAGVRRSNRSAGGMVIRR
jgi:CheY-like chemotaxis protein